MQLRSCAWWGIDKPDQKRVRPQEGLGVMPPRSCKRPTKGQLSKAVDAMRLYLGSQGQVRVRDEQRLYKRVSAHVEKISVKGCLDAGDVWDQLSSEAQRRGIRMAVPGKDI